jgi:hypothetical protein
VWIDGVTEHAERRRLERSGTAERQLTSQAPANPLVPAHSGVEADSGSKRMSFVLGTFRRVSLGSRTRSLGSFWYTFRSVGFTWLIFSSLDFAVPVVA